jgi:hypothetical protein
VSTAPTTKKYDKIGIRIGDLQAEVQRQALCGVPVSMPGTLKRAVEK